MDKQDFQEQDFMEILMRLPCGRDDTSECSRPYAHVLAVNKLEI